jgi:hypothetical protein
LRNLATDAQSSNFIPYKTESETIMHTKIKIVVIGGNGLIGTKVVSNLRQRRAC